MPPTTPDRNLWPALQDASADELAPLVQILREKSVDWLPPDGDAEVLRSSVHDELLANGGNTLANLFRGGGPEWSAVVRKVADKVNVAYSDADDVLAIEERVALCILDQAIAKMSPEELAELRRRLEEAGLPKDIPLGKGALLAGLLAGRFAGFAAYQVLVIVANAVARVLVGHGLGVATNAALARGLGVLLGPVGLVVTGLLTALDLTGPALRITIPGVVFVAVLRASHQHALPEAVNAGRQLSA